MRFFLMDGSSTTISSKTAKASKVADKGRVTNTLQSPRDNSRARRRFARLPAPTKTATWR